MQESLEHRFREVVGLSVEEVKKIEKSQETASWIYLFGFAPCVAVGLGTLLPSLDKSSSFSEAATTKMFDAGVPLLTFGIVCLLASFYIYNMPRMDDSKTYECYLAGKELQAITHEVEYLLKNKDYHTPYHIQTRQKELENCQNKCEKLKNEKACQNKSLSNGEDGIEQVFIIN